MQFTFAMTDRQRAFVEAEAARVETGIGEALRRLLDHMLDEHDRKQARRQARMQVRVAGKLEARRRTADAAKLAAD